MGRTRRATSPRSSPPFFRVTMCMCWWRPCFVACLLVVARGEHDPRLLEAAMEIMQSVYSDRDGKVTHEEVYVAFDEETNHHDHRKHRSKQRIQLESEMPKVDANSDGFLDKYEMATLLKALQSGEEEE